MSSSRAAITARLLRWFILSATKNAVQPEPAGWPEVVIDPFSRERAQAIREFVMFGDRPDWISAYFAWMAEKLPVKVGCGFDWVIQKSTFIRAKEGNFSALAGDA